MVDPWGLLGNVSRSCCPSSPPTWLREPIRPGKSDSENGRTGLHGAIHGDKCDKCDIIIIDDNNLLEYHILI